MTNQTVWQERLKQLLPERWAEKRRGFECCGRDKHTVSAEQGRGFECCGRGKHAVSEEQGRGFECCGRGDHEMKAGQCGS